MDEKDILILEEDKQAHPNCTYSQSFFQSCTNTNDKVACETIKNILSNCPGKKSVQIVSSRVVSDSTEDMENIKMPSMNFPSFGFEGNSSSLLDGIFNGFGHYPDENSRRVNRRQRLNDPVYRKGNGEFNSSEIVKEIVGSVEDV